MLAQSLSWNPVSIYEWVKNNIETEWYWGSMKGAEETLRQRSGNACDQASLLIALLRASGYPSRYVRGTIEFFPDIERAKNLFGIDEPQRIAEYLQKAGVPFKAIISGGRISNLQIEHIWVETYVPYANYRGAILDEHGKTWLGLDTSIKVSGYAYNTPADIPEGISLANLREEYLGAIHAETPLQYLKAYINSQLSNRPQPITYDDLLRTRALIPEVMNILPASLQFRQTRITHEYGEIPDELKHRVKFIATASPDRELFTITLDTSKLSNQKIVLTYEPESRENQEIIHAYGGLGNTPAYLIRLRPVLKVNGERVAVGKDGLAMGSEFQLALELISPNGVERITNPHITGNLSVMGIVAQRAFPMAEEGLSTTPSPLVGEVGGEGGKGAEQILYEEVLRYIGRWNQAEEELASLMRLAITRPIPTVVNLGGVIDVTYLLGTPHGFEWKGVYVDADLRPVETVRSTEFGVRSENQKLFMQLSSLHGSILENRLFEDDFKVESISTAKLFGLTRSTQPVTEILTIDKSNIASALPTLPFDQNLKEDIENSVNQNLTIRIPQSEIIYEDWRGVGYIKENPETGESGYMLSGMIAGGMTAWGLDKWPQYYLDILKNPYAEPPNRDPASAVEIQKMANSDLQEGEVGEALFQPLSVKVRDKKKKGVAGVEVTFTVKAGGGKFEKNGLQIIKVNTDGLGIASARFILGQKTLDNPTYRWRSDYKYGQQVGENLVDASLPSGIRIPKPFTAYGFPKEASKIEKIQGDGKSGSILSFAGGLAVRVTDKFDNPITNLPVHFEVLSPIELNTVDCKNKNKDNRGAILVSTTDPCVNFMPPLAPTMEEMISLCKTASPSQEVVTDSKGISAIQLILGSVPDAKYPVIATYKGLRAVFDEFTLPFGNCDGTEDPSTRFVLEWAYVADNLGNNINAGKVKTQIPLMARIYFLNEDDTQKEFLFDCSGTPINCNKVIGARTYKIVEKFNIASVHFGEQEGVSVGGGIYVHSYELKPGKNEVLVRANASIDVQRTRVCPDCATGKVTLHGNTSDTLVVYGVEVKLEPLPIILVDEMGYAQEDYTISYKIEPAEYKAQTVYVVIWKDNEVVATIPDLTKSGSVAISRGFQFDMNSVYEVEVVLNYGTGVEIRSDKVELRKANLYIEKEDPEFPDVKLRWNDYYPALGSKVITIINPGNSLKDRVVKCETLDATDEEVAQINPPVTPPTCEAIDDKITNGKMRFRLTGTALAPRLNDDPATGIDEIGLGFYLVEEGKQNYDIIAYYKVKNNFNTTFGEVLTGEAVFAYDPSSADNHVGKTGENVINDDYKKFDFVQELLNQVVPRKRSVTTYTLLNENGVFDSDVKGAVRLLREHFNISTHKNQNDKNTFNKLMKDYELRGQESSYFDLIVDKEILIGKYFRAGDQVINQATSGDTGLYELYVNVVSPFINVMIQEAERFAGNEPTDNWVARTGEGPANSTNPHGPGMSYCFGCKNTVEEFNNTVANCQAESTTNIKGRETDGILGNEYRGNIGAPGCVPGMGNRRWPGLINTEYNLYGRCVVLYARCISQGDPRCTAGQVQLALTCTASDRLQGRPFNPTHWSGIDCSGLVQWAVERGRNTASGLTITIPSPPGDIKASGFFTTDRVMYLPNPAGDEEKVRLQKKLQKGDLVKYDGHISMIYSEKPTCPGNSCNYRIIHASGDRCLDIDGNGLCDAGEPFNRKVVANSTQYFRKNPIGFGRIKLWN